MAYSDFTLESALDTLGLTLREEPDLFAGTPPVEPGPLLTMILAEFLPLALAISTEKARSEMIVAPVLASLRAHLKHSISLFSGTEFNVDSGRNLTGRCDFLISRSPEQLVLRAPVAALVEAKRDDISSGLGQCAATLVAAGVFNARAGRPPQPLHGAVTTGSLWQFMRLDGQTLTADQREYHINELPRLFGVLVRIASD